MKVPQGTGGGARGGGRYGSQVCRTRLLLIGFSSLLLVLAGIFKSRAWLPVRQAYPNAAAVFTIGEEEEEESNGGLSAGTWWMRELELREYPWRWRWFDEADDNSSLKELEDRHLIEFLYPCESTCAEVYCESGERKKRVACRLNCTDPVTCDAGFKDMTKSPESCEAVLSKDSTTSSSSGEACFKDRKRVCSLIRHRRKVAYVEFIPKRDVFTLADVATQIRRGQLLSSSKKKPAKEPSLSETPGVSILLMGDSVAHEYLHLARCHLMRTIHVMDRQMVTVPRGPGRNYFIPSWLTMSRERSNRIEWVASSTFRIPSKDFGVFNLNLTLQLANKAPAQDLELLLDSCLRHDLIVFDWGLHYANPYEENGLYEQEMTKVVEVFKECLEMAQSRGQVKTIVYANHPMQHFFPSHDKGWFNHSREVTNRSCGPLPAGKQQPSADKDELDGWTRILRFIAEQSSSQSEEVVITPVAWGQLKRAYCPSSTSKERRRIYWVPYMELTEEFHDLKKPKKGDCTHLDSIPQMGTPLWDALFWSVLQQTNEQTTQCLAGPPQPEFSSLAKYRTTAEAQQTVTGNYREHYEHSQKADNSLMPLVEARHRHNVTKMEWKERVSQWEEQLREEDKLKAVKDAQVDEARREKLGN